MRALGITKIAIVVACLVSLSLPAFAAEDGGTLSLALRKRVETRPGSGRFHTIVQPAKWDAKKTAIIVCDVWDSHHCLNAVRRVEEMAPRMDQLLTAARQRGALIIHAPSGCMDAYKDHPARQNALKTPRAKNLPKDIGSWCHRIPAEEKGAYPIDQGDGGEDDDPAEHRAWAEKLQKMGRNPRAPWKAEIAVLKIDDRDVISDKGEEIWSVLQQRGIENVILVGVHTNMCVLGRPFGLRQMAKNGKNVVLMRDLTDTMYNPARFPFVSHFTGTDLIVEHIEKWVCPSITSDQILGGKPFRFSGDKRPHLVLIIAESEYQTAQTLPAFALKHLGKDFRVSIVYGSAPPNPPQVGGGLGGDDLPGLDVLNDADLALISVRRRALPTKQMDIIRKFIASGKPLVGIRTASHAFSLRGKKPPQGCATWETFDPDVFGGHYTNHHGDGPKVEIKPAEGAAGHPILSGVSLAELHGNGSLYKVSPLAKSATPLLIGSIADKPAEPILWTHTTKAGGRVVYTSLGHPDDFKEPAFNRLLSNAIHWAAEQPKPDKRSAVNIPALIDKLVEVADNDIGYSAIVTGSSFLPLDREGHFGMGLLFQNPSVPSETMREIVKQGAAAVPHLIAHLGDKRKTKIASTGGYYSNEYDYNKRTTKPPPALARREDGEEEDGLSHVGDLSNFGPMTKEPHTPTVGDLCFVALGQIVNRSFNAVRYQPSMIIIISSPTQSPALLAAIKREWGTLTPERHRASLIADFLKPDSADRRNGACKHLAYYYPDALEPLAVRFLAQPTYDGFDVESFVRKTLYQTKDARKRRELFEAYLSKKGQPSRDGILKQLFHDLDIRFGKQPREMLIELYGCKKDVDSSQEPRFLDAIEAAEKARLIDEGLIYDHSVKIDRAVRDLLASIEKDDYLALACMRRLVGRGYDADIEKYCRRRIPQLKEDDRKELQEMLDRVGWNSVHVAVERHDGDGLRALIAEGANVQAKARNGTTPLHVAAAAGDETSLRLLLDAKAAPDPKNARGETPVQFAARADHDEMVRFLIQKGCAVSDIFTAAIVGQRERAAALLSQNAALIHATTAHKRTLLHLAARWGDASVTELLLDKGAAVNAVDEEGWTPLLVAVAWKHEPVARVLLAHKADVKAKLPDAGLQPLHLAVKTGDAKLVRLLLSYRADVNAVVENNAWDEAFVKPLHLAVIKGDPAIVELLLDAGAAIEARDGRRRTPLHVAAALGQAEVARVLLKHKADVAARVRGKHDEHAGYQPLQIAAAEGHVAVMELLLAYKADVRATTDLLGETPLHCAAQNGHIDAARFLLKRGIDVNARDSYQKTPLHDAASCGQVKMIRFLLENKADIQAVNDGNESPLFAACWASRSEAIRVLLDHKADVNVREKQYGQTPLHVAALSEDPALVKLLLDRGAAVDAVDTEGQTPLHYAARRANVQAARLLLDHGADINARQKKDGRTPLHRAIEAVGEGRSRLAVIALLLNRKADCTIKDKDGLTPLALAIQKDRAKIIQLLRKQGAKK